LITVIVAIVANVIADGIRKLIDSIKEDK